MNWMLIFAMLHGSATPVIGYTETEALCNQAKEQIEQKFQPVIAVAVLCVPATIKASKR